MSIHTIVNREGIYFITFTCFNWLHLLKLANSYDLVYKWFDYLEKRQIPVLGYVIMPNHVHLLLRYSNTAQSLNTIVGNGKRFIGYELVKRLEDKGEKRVLKAMQEALGSKDRERNKKHQLWQGSFEVKECRTESFILQKLNYMHDNPVAERWKLADRPISYPHSSALQYNVGKVGAYKVKDYREVLAGIKT
jgi:REP element-mobilizing transposase RayT